MRGIGELLHLRRPHAQVPVRAEVEDPVRWTGARGPVPDAAKARAEQKRSAPPAPTSKAPAPARDAYRGAWPSSTRGSGSGSSGGGGNGILDFLFDLFTGG